ncbi:glutamate carboxypeptidase II [Ilyonectria robusta]
MGSTEWVEDHLPELIGKTVAYINVDTAVSGPRAEIVGSGEIQTIAIEMMKKVIFPDGYGAGPTLYDAWYNATEGVIGPLGSGSDFAAFYHNGISSVSARNSLSRYHRSWLTLFTRLTFREDLAQRTLSICIIGELTLPVCGEIVPDSNPPATAFTTLIAG